MYAVVFYRITTVFSSRWADPLPRGVTKRGFDSIHSLISHRINYLRANGVRKKVSFINIVITGNPNRCSPKA
jgi:hypothetical protein